MNRAVQGLWIGALSPIEIACITSYLNQGHDFHLYSYQNIQDLPKGATLKDANEIIPEAEIFQIQQGNVQGSYAGFADLFRYKLLHEKGGWWTDMDFLCFNPLPKPNILFFASEWNPRYIRRGSQRKLLLVANKYFTRFRRYLTHLLISGAGVNHIMNFCFTASPTCSLMFCEPGNPIIAQAYSQAQNIVSNGITTWGQIGPALITNLITHKAQNTPYQLGDPNRFMPISYSEIPLIFQETKKVDTANIYTIHLYNEVWRQNGFNKTDPIAPGCLLGKLLREARVQQ